MKIRGAFTAIVTPFNRAGEVDYERFGQLLEAQVAAGMDGVVPVGTTGESPTLSVAEHRQVIEFAVEQIAGRALVIAGTGGNATAEALELTRHAQTAGADACLQVTPYYNKPSQAGLIQHFTAIADVGLPVVLYNIPGRTGCALTVETVQALSRHPAVVAIKEAGGDVDRVSAYIAAGCELDIVSGDDSLTLPMMAVGGVGVISVAANVVPGAVRDMVHAALDGRWAEAQSLHQQWYRLFRDLFLDTNPIPVKAALAMMGQIEAHYRLPLCELSDAHQRQLRATMKQVALLDG